MTPRPLTNVAASVRQRLLNRARTEGRAFQELATLYTMERFLFRLGRSAHADRFVLKGGLMTLTWAGEYARITRDIDLLGWGTNSVAAVVERIRAVLEVEVDDGVLYDTGSLQGREITVETAYVGVRLSFTGLLAGMRLRPDGRGESGSLEEFVTRSDWSGETGWPHSGQPVPPNHISHPPTTKPQVFRPGVLKMWRPKASASQTSWGAVRVFRVGVCRVG